jgi:hypothetical protein
MPALEDGRAAEMFSLRSVEQSDQRTGVQK